MINSFETLRQIPGRHAPVARCLFTLLAMGCLGCEEAGQPPAQPVQYSGAGQPAADSAQYIGTATPLPAAAKAAPGGMGGMMGGGMMGGSSAYASARAAPGEKAITDLQGGDTTQTQIAPPASTVVRKIVYNARVDLIVEGLADLQKKVTSLIKENEAYVSESDASSATQAQRRMMWKIRVPVEKFDSFMATVAGLGELQQNHTDSQDVTQEFYDTEARIANKQKEEKRLQKHLDESTGKLEDILAVERELTRVRGEIEQMQGRIRYLANVAAMSTITLTATEIKNYTPPVAPTFATQIGRTFSDSIEKLADFGRGLVLVVVALAPWIPVLALVIVPVIWLIRRQTPVRPVRSER